LTFIYTHRSSVGALPVRQAPSEVAASCSAKSPDRSKPPIAVTDAGTSVEGMEIIELGAAGESPSY
jgi:hypothetical protein